MEFNIGRWLFAGGLTGSCRRNATIPWEDSFALEWPKNGQAKKKQLSYDCAEVEALGGLLLRVFPRGININQF